MKTIKKTVKISTSSEINRDDPIKLLKLPEDAEIFVNVPGGGDWSNMRLDIGEDSNIFIRHSETKTEECREEIAEEINKTK